MLQVLPLATEPATCHSDRTNHSGKYQGKALRLRNRALRCRRSWRRRRPAWGGWCRGHAGQGRNSASANRTKDRPEHWRCIDTGRRVSAAAGKRWYLVRGKWPEGDRKRVDGNIREAHVGEEARWLIEIQQLRIFRLRQFAARKVESVEHLGPAWPWTMSRRQHLGRGMRMWMNKYRQLLASSPMDAMPSMTDAMDRGCMRQGLAVLLPPALAVGLCGLDSRGADCDKDQNEQKLQGTTHVSNPIEQLWSICCLSCCNFGTTVQKKA